ncbi:MAG: phosphoribosylanthranilate isomerase [Acidobacteriaceae bacterium]
MWVKICGITTREDALMAVQAGADALGFVFAEGPRYVTPENVKKIAESLPPSVEKIGVFVSAPLEFMLRTIEQAGLTGVQLHGERAQNVVESLRERMTTSASRFRIVQVLHYGGDAGRFESQLQALLATSATDTILVDTGIAGRQGGTGVPFDWGSARQSFLGHASRVRLIAAGGLNPENVQQAIHTLQPWGVDVSSGVEAAPGYKDRERVNAFLRAARASVAFAGKAGVGVPR